MKISYNWLKWYVPEIPEADKLADVFMYHLCEVESVEKLADLPAQAGGDTIFDLNILPNRAHDLLSHQGIARELSGLLGIAFNDPTPKYKIPESQKTKLEIDTQTDTCRRYMGRIVRNIKVGPSPDWVVKHLESIGQRSINNIVDATNITMFDCGQPVHAFDLDKLTSEKIIIRQAKDSETMTTLDQKNVTFTPDDMVIADEKNILAIAGVKGGIHAEVDENTKNILIEVANFEPVSVRKTAQRLKIFTDAVKRFENDLSPELASFAMREMSGLILEILPEAVFEEIVDVYPEKQKVWDVSFSTEDVNGLLGSTISAEEIEKILKQYQYSHKKEGDTFTITVPPLRLDITGAHDMVEEIGRVYGYEKIVPTIPKIDFVPKVNETTYKILAIRKKLVDEGYREVMTYTFAEKGEVEVLASASDKKFLRTNLADGLKESFKLNKLNAPILGLNEVKIFEIGTVFTKQGEEVHVAYGDEKQMKEVSLEDFAKESGIDVGDSYGSLLEFPKQGEEKFTQWSLYPFIARDIAVWVPEDTKPDALVQIFKSHGTDLLVRPPRLFDTFSKPASPAGGDGKTSYAFNLVFQAQNRTLTDGEVNTIMSAIAEAISANPLWKVR